MRASEWQYLCAVHDPPKSCCAIDYCCHTLDWASSVLTSQKHFPSRLTLGSESSGGTQQGVRQLTNVFRRVYRIFAHAWFQHRQVFWQVEGYDGLYMFFKTVCDFYSLIPEDNYTIPPEAEGIMEDAKSEKVGGSDKPAVTATDEDHRNGQLAILRKEDDDNGEDTDPTTTISTGATTRRHKHTPSTGSSVTTIVEGDDEDKKTKGDEHVTAAATEIEEAVVEEEGGAAVAGTDTNADAETDTDTETVHVDEEQPPLSELLASENTMDETNNDAAQLVATLDSINVDEQAELKATATVSEKAAEPKSQLQEEEQEVKVESKESNEEVREISRENTDEQVSDKTLTKMVEEQQEKKEKDKNNCKVTEESEVFNLKD